MMHEVLRRIRKIVRVHFLHESLSDFYIREYRKQGTIIGDNCSINSLLPSGRDAFLLHIGNNVTISTACHFLLHDASIGNASGFVKTDCVGKIVISDNCFIGCGAIILPGVFIANGVIVGAGSVVTKSISTPNVVVAGNPAKYICTKEQYLEKNLAFAFDLSGIGDSEAKALINSNPQKLLKR